MCGPKTPVDIPPTRTLEDLRGDRTWLHGGIEVTTLRATHPILLRGAIILLMLPARPHFPRNALDTFFLTLVSLPSLPVPRAQLLSAYLRAASGAFPARAVRAATRPPRHGAQRPKIARVDIAYARPV